MLAEMGIIRNGITSNNTDLTEFKRNTATVQQQLQQQIIQLQTEVNELRMKGDDHSRSAQINN